MNYPIIAAKYKYCNLSSGCRLGKHDKQAHGCSPLPVMFTGAAGCYEGVGGANGRGDRLLEDAGHQEYDSGYC